MEIFSQPLSLLGLNTATAGLRVFACEPEWAALATELGGDRLTVTSATTALQDPHHIEARPALIAQLRQADLAVCTGAELEAGWMPQLLRQAGNPRVQPGGTGYFSATDYVTLLEKPTRLDRADGDVHAAGNPHIQTDPRTIAAVAEALSQRLIAIDAANADNYRQRYIAFAQRWKQALERWTREAAPLRGMAIVTQHKGWIYLIDWLGLKEVAVLEPKPGVEPSGAYLAQVLQTLARQPARMVIRAAYQDRRPSHWMADHAHLAEVELPFTVGGSPAAKDLFGLFDDTLQRLLAATR